MVYQLYRSLPRQLGISPCYRRAPVRNASFISRVTSPFRKLGETETISSGARKVKGASGKPEKPPSARETTNKRKFAYPERLAAYHAGTGRNTFLACMKVTTVLTLAFYGLVVAPSTYRAGEPWWKVAGVALCGLVPFCFIAYVTAPFVTFVHIHLPDFARQSKEILHRFAKNPPANTRLELTTISLIGKPRVSPMTISDLRPANQRFGLVNYTRDTAAIDAKRKWYMYRAVGQFNIPQRPGQDAKDAGIWDDIAATISRRVQLQK